MTKNHKDDITNWDAVETFCDGMAVMTKRRADQKRAQKPERKEILKKADQKRSQKPERKEAKKKIDQNRSQKPERKEVVKKADQKREPVRSQKPD